MNVGKSTLQTEVSGLYVTALRSITKVFIEKMPKDLDQYLRAEIAKQFKGSLTVVLDKKDDLHAGQSRRK